MNNIKNKYFQKPPNTRTLYSRNYYQLNKEKKKQYYNEYYRKHREYIKSYNKSRKARTPTQFARENKETIINFD